MITTATHPALSGRQVELLAGRAQLTVAQVGASLRRLRVHHIDVLGGYTREEVATAAQGQALVPWPNRLAGGRYTFEDRRLQLPLTEPERGNAIHGLARWAAWEVTRRARDRTTLAHVIWPQPGYPFILAVEVTYVLDPGGLTVQTVAANAGQTRLPYGVGFHPYLTVGTSRIDDAWLELRAASRLETDRAGIPTGRREPTDGTAFGFSRRHRIGDVRLDTAYTDLARDGERAWLVLEAPDGHRRLRLWMDEQFRWVMLFTGDDLPDGRRRRRALGVEPMTCAPNALQTGDGLIVLRAGERHVSRWGLRWD